MLIYRIRPLASVQVNAKRCVNRPAAMQANKRLTASIALDSTRAQADQRFRDCAVVWRALGVSMIITLGFLGVTSVSARDGSSGSGFSRPAWLLSTHPSRARVPFGVGRPQVAARHPHMQEGRGLHRHGLTQTGLPITLWPGEPPTIQTEAPPPEEAAPPPPQVIVLAAPHGGSSENAAPAAPADYSYVTGCHAIPNGYHCDAPGTETH